MTLRNYLAAQVAPAYLADQLRRGVIIDCREVASFSYELADFMIEESKK